MDIYINLDALDLKTAAVVSKDDLRSKPLKELVAGENQVINLYTTAKTGSPNIQDYSTVRVGIGNINAVPTSGSYTVTYGTKTEFISFNELSSSIAAKFYNLTDAQIQGVTTVAPQTYKIDFQYAGPVAVPSITDDTDLYPASTVTISELSVGSATTKASWLLKTNQDALALTSTFTNISPQGISGVLNTATTGIYEKLQSSKFFKTTLEVEVVDSASRLSTILQVPISVKGEVIGLSVEPPHATPSPYALVTYVDSKTAANASSITTNTTAISGHTTDINALNDGEQINSAGISANTTNITANTTTISGHTTDINALYDGEQINSENIATNLASISSLDSLKAPKASPIFSGSVDLSSYTSVSRSTGVTALNPVQNYQPATDDTVCNLCVDTAGNVVRGSQEATWTFDNTQLNALTSVRVNLLNSPGADKCVVVEETNWLIEVDLLKSYQATNVNLKCEMLGVNANSIATTITAANLNQIAQILKTANTNSFGLYHRDVPDLARIYRFDVPMTIRATNGAGATNVFPDNFVSVKLKIKYRVFDKDTF